MTRSNIADLKKIAVDAYRIFRKYSEIESHLSNYPKGMCRLASDLVGVGFIRAGLEGVFIAFQGENNGWLHAWIEYDNIVIDITCYQFKDYWDDVYVGPLTIWHKQFKGQERRMVDKGEIVSHWRKVLINIDDIICDLYTSIQPYSQR